MLVWRHSKFSARLHTIMFGERFLYDFCPKMTDFQYSSFPKKRLEITTLLQMELNERKKKSFACSNWRTIAKETDSECAEQSVRAHSSNLRVDVIVCSFYMHTKFAAIYLFNVLNVRIQFALYAMTASSSLFQSDFCLVFILFEFNFCLFVSLFFAHSLYTCVTFEF